MITRIGIALGGVLVLALTLALIIFGNSLMPQGRFYDCSLAEFHPDYPVEVKNECRKLRSQKLTST
jgi:hypothetical protein